MGCPLVVVGTAARMRSIVIDGDAMVRCPGDAEISVRFNGEET